MRFMQIESVLQTINRSEPAKNRFSVALHVIFSWAQIGRSAIFGREIGVPDREIFSRQKKSSLMSKIVYLHQRRSL